MDAKMPLAATGLRAGRILRNAVVDLRYGGLLTSVINSDYRGLDHIFAGRIRNDDVLVDVGCGRGRVINWWLHNGFRGNPIYGLELDPAVAEKVRRRLSGYPNVTVIAGDAVESLPADATLLYLFNPFEEEDVRRFVERVIELYSARGVTVLYYNCKHVHCFEERREFTVDVLRPGGDSSAPFDRLAVIELAPSRVKEGGVQQ